MTQVTITHTIPTPATEAPDARRIDRRRPGRTDVAPELIPLLRARQAPDAITDDRDWTVLEDEDGMAPARGIALGLLLALPFWGVVGLAGFWVFG